MSAAVAMDHGSRVSALIHLDEVRSYFSGGKWKGHWSKDSFEGSIDIADVKIKASGRSYSVKIESVDDPSDSDEVATGEPLRAIADFLGRDIPGGEHFERMSSVPSMLADSIAVAAELVGSGVIGRRAVVRMLRRLSSFSHVAEGLGSRPGADLSDLESEAKKKGWKARLKKDHYGDDVLMIDVSGIYSAEVTLDSLVYQYSFELRGESSVDDSGTTDDPIREFRRWARDPEVDAAVRRIDAMERQSLNEPTRLAPAE